MRAMFGVVGLVLALAIVGVLAKYGLADWFKGWHYSWIQDRIRSFDGQPISDLSLEQRVRLAYLIRTGRLFI